MPPITACRRPPLFGGEFRGREIQASRYRSKFVPVHLTRAPVVFVGQVLASLDAPFIIRTSSYSIAVDSLCTCHEEFANLVKASISLALLTNVHDLHRYISTRDMLGWDFQLEMLFFETQTSLADNLMYAYEQLANCNLQREQHYVTRQMADEILFPPHVLPNLSPQPAFIVTDSLI